MKAKASSYYRSGLEGKVAKLLPRNMFKYEPFTIPYTTYRNYTPDFVAGEFDEYIVEVKGFFRVGDTQKYKAIRDSLPENQELIFMLADKNKKVRKGAKMTMGQWCAKEKITGFDLKEMDAFLEYCTDDRTEVQRS